MNYKLSALRQIGRLLEKSNFDAHAEDALRLSLDEVRAIAARRRVTDEWLLEALYRQSEGWAAGITEDSGDYLDRIEHGRGKRVLHAEFSLEAAARQRAVGIRNFRRDDMHRLNVRRIGNRGARVDGRRNRKMRRIL